MYPLSTKCFITVLIPRSVSPVSVDNLRIDVNTCPHFNFTPLTVTSSYCADIRSLVYTANAVKSCLPFILKFNNSFLNLKSIFNLKTARLQNYSLRGCVCVKHTAPYYYILLYVVVLCVVLCVVFYFCKP